jgi:vacuolar protein sorting-associated protein 13A/C
MAPRSSIAMNYLESGRTPTAFISSEDSKDKNLLKVKYVRAQQDSPEFMTVFDGIDQSVDVGMSTLVLRAQPEPVIAIYDFLMTTFVPQKGPAVPTPALEKDLKVSPQQQQTMTEQIRVRVKLESVQGAPRPADGVVLLFTNFQ